MEPFLIAGVIIAASGLIGFIAHTQSKARKAAWAQAARAMELALDDGGLFSSPKIEGRLGGCRISIYTYTRSTGNSHQSFTAIEVTGNLFDGLKLKKEGVGTSIGKLFVGDDLQIGDPHFDREVNVQGAPMKAQALLDAGARSMVLDLLTDGGTIENNTIKWTTSGVVKDATLMESQTRKLVRLANALSLGGRDVGEALAENAVRDPLPTVRLRNLERLLSSGVHSKTGLEAARSCLTDPVPAVALRAALALGHEGLPHVQQLVNRQDIPPMLRIQALEVLGDRGEGALITMLDSGDVGVVRSAAQALEKCGTLAAVEPLLKHSKGLLTDGELKRAARQAIDAIQARRGGGERGAFSIAEGGDQQGALSVAEGDRRGALSHAAKKPDPAR